MTLTKWCIKRTSNNKSVVNKWFNKLVGVNIFKMGSAYLHFPKYRGSFVYDRIQQGYKEISFDDFKKYIVDTTAKSSDVTIINNRKIIGYKSPIDLFQGQVKAGTLFKKTGSGLHYWILDENGDCKFMDFKVPTEIAETWTPVYEELFKVGDWVTVTKEPTPDHWLFDTKQRTFRLTTEPTAFYRTQMWSSSGIDNKNTGSGFGLLPDTFRLATEEEIEAVNTPTVGSIILLTNVSEGSRGILKNGHILVKYLGKDANYSNGCNVQMGKFIVEEENGRKWNVGKPEWKPATLTQTEYFGAIKVGQYVAEISKNQVAFGCQVFTLADIDSYLKIYSSEAKGFLTVKGERITQDMLFKLKNRIKSLNN